MTGEHERGVERSIWGGGSVARGGEAVVGSSHEAYARDRKPETLNPAVSIHLQAVLLPPYVVQHGGVNFAGGVVDFAAPKSCLVPTPDWSRPITMTAILIIILMTFTQRKDPDVGASAASRATLRWRVILSSSHSPQE